VRPDLLGGADGVALRNRGIAELLHAEAERATGHRHRALRRAAGRAFLWPEEAVDLLEEGRSLTELSCVGPYIARTIEGFVASGAVPPEPPPLRRGFLTLCEAREALARDASLASGCRGDLQTHTTWSDGSASIAEMADAARARGHRWIAITDHSDGQPIPPGIGAEGLEAQRAEIEALEAASADGFRVLRSMEMNLHPSGEGDLDPATSARLDLTLGAFHSALRRREDQTARYLAGLRNPSIQVLAHPRCRMRGSRTGLVADWRAVFAEAARLGKAVEVDGDPWRQDLDVSLAEVAREEGCRISLGSDAHAPDDLVFLEIALGAAALARLPRERILNFLPAEEVAAWAASVRERRPGPASRVGVRTTSAAARRSSPRRGSRPATRRSRGRGSPGTP
jgi:histidinol phosphatase-like PHP family hydrolase